MQIGPYSFTNLKTFMGRDGYGMSFSIYKDGHRFAYYTDAGNGGMGDVKPYPEKKTKPDWNGEWALIREFEEFAGSHSPKYPADEEYGLPEHDGDQDYFASAVAAWMELEKTAKKNGRDGHAYIAVLMENSFPRMSFALEQYNEKLVREIFLRDKDRCGIMKKPAFVILPTGPVTFESDFPMGTPLC